MRKEPIIIGAGIAISTQLTQSIQCDPVMFKSQGKIIEVIPEVTMEITKPNYIDFPTNPICGREQRRERRKKERKNKKR